MKTEKGGTFRLIVYAAFVLSILGNVIAISAFLHVQNLDAVVLGNATSGAVYTASGALFAPPMTLPDAPVITATAPAGARLTGINQPFTASELAVINGAPNDFFEQGGLLYLNGSLQNSISSSAVQSNLLQVNGKPSVIYLGAISCIYCGENRWAMALALGRFGNFTALFRGYSALGDGDVPTIYWRPAEYNATAGVDIGNFYNSSLINFLSIEYVSPISGNFQMGSLPYISSAISRVGSAPYEQAMKMITVANNFVGTPYTVWGKYAVPQADAQIFGNTSAVETLPNMTHDQVLGQLANPADQFAWSEYAAADVYVALMCATLNNAPAVCGLPAIGSIQTLNGY